MCGPCFQYLKGLSAKQVLPLMANGRRLGALFLSSQQENGLTPQIMELVREYSAHVAQLLSAWAAQEEQLAGVLVAACVVIVVTTIQDSTHLVCCLAAAIPAAATTFMH
jgi:hypothetical protein